MRRLLAVALAAASLAGCYAPPPTFGELPDFSLSAVSAGTAAKPISRADLLGRVWVTDFIFTHCEGPCPALSNDMARLQKDLPARVGLLTITVDPERDDAKVLSEYAKHFGADPDRWLFVTGPQGAVVDLLTRGFKLPAFKDAKAPSGRRVTHSTRLVLVDAKGRLRGYFDGQDEGELQTLRRVATRL